MLIDLALVWVFQSTLPAGGATRRESGEITPKWISIHAPRGGSDNDLSAKIRERFDFNPRSPRGERLPMV